MGVFEVGGGGVGEEGAEGGLDGGFEVREGAVFGGGFVGVGEVGGVGGGGGGGGRGGGVEPFGGFGVGGEDGDTVGVREGEMRVEEEEEVGESGAEREAWSELGPGVWVGVED